MSGLSDIKIFYTLFYAVVGAHLPYFPLYLHEKGLSASQIGSIVGIQGISIIFIPPLTGFIADNFSNGLKLIKYFGTIGIVLALIFTLNSENFIYLALNTFLFGFFVNPLFSLMDGAGVSMGVYYSLYSLYLYSLNVTPTYIGLIYNFGVIVEILFMFVSAWFVRKFGIKYGMLFASISCFFRFLACGVGDSILMASISQFGHAGIIFALSILSGTYITNICSQSQRYTTLSLFLMINSGVARLIGATAIPWLVSMFFVNDHDVSRVSMQIAALVGLLSVLFAIRIHRILT